MKVSGPQNPHHHHAEVGDADDDLDVELSPARFREKCAERGRARAFSPSSSLVENAGGQEAVIALLLGQQEEVLREIRDQKKGLALSQSNKEEIARLVISSLKSQHLQWPTTEGSPPLFHPPAHATAGRSKRATKKRRRRKPSCSSDGIFADRGKAGPAHLNESCACCNTNPTTIGAAAAEPPWFPQEDVSNHRPKQKASTVIRQSVEKQAERVEVSLDGLWLPSLPSPGTADSAALADRWRGSSRSPDRGAAGWADRDHDPSSTPAGCSYPTAARLLPRSRGTQDPPVELRGQKNPMRSRRPVTVASQAPCRTNKTLRGGGRSRTSPNGENRRSGAVTAGGGGEWARHAGTPKTKSWTSRLESSRYADGAEADSDRDGPAKDGPVGWSQSGGAEGDAWSGAATPISQHTAAMLKRSQALVARAKAFCGQAARSSAPRRGREDGGPAPDPPQGHNSDCNDRYQGRDRGGRVVNLEGESDDSAAGEAGSILFASPSPAQLLSLRPPGEANADAHAEADADIVREGGWRRSSLLASTGDSADEGDVGRGEEVGYGVTEATLEPEGSTESLGTKLAQAAEAAQGEKTVVTAAPSEAAEAAGASAAAKTAETAGAAGAAESAGAAEAADAAEAAGEARAAAAGRGGGAARSIEAVESTEDAFEGEENQEEVRLGMGSRQTKYGRPSWNDSTHPDPAELARHGSASASTLAGGRNPGRVGDERITSGKRMGKPGCDTSAGIGGGGSGGDANSAKVDTEWENEIAKNILSLYQTKLKDELDKKREAREEEAGRKTRGYLTAEEEEDLLLEQQQRKKRQQQQQQQDHRDRRKTYKGDQNTSPPHRIRRGGDASSRSCSLSPQQHLKRATTAAETGGGTVRFPGVDDNTKPRPSTTIVLPPARTAATAVGVSSSAATLAGVAQGRAGKARPRPSVTRSGGATTAAHEPRGRESRGRAPSTVAGDASSPSHPFAAGTPITSTPATAIKHGDHAPLSGVGGGGSGAAGGGKAATGRGGFRGSRTVSVPTRGGGEAVVVVPKRPRPIWFAGSGAVQAEWSALPGGARVVRDLEGLEEQGRYTKYVAIVESLLAAHLRADDQQGPTELVKKLWKQLVVTCTAFGVRNIENRRFERSLELLKRAEVLLSRQVLEKRATLELRAFVSDAYGLYYLRRGKSSAALDYVQKAMKTHARMQDWGHVTKCHLHSAVVLSKLSRHDEALRCLGQVLSMVEEGKLDVGGNSPQKLCLVAICYHNMAVEQLNLRHASEACMSSQNARRLARLCLSYSNRWLHFFEGTHKLALAELARALPATKGGSGGGGRGAGAEADREQMEMLTHLTEQLFS